MEHPDLGPLLKLKPPAPALPPPEGKVVRAGNAGELAEALRAPEPGTTILLAEGRYLLPPGLTLARDGIAVRGESGDREKVILDGCDRFDRMLTIKGADDVLIADVTFTNGRQYGVFILGDSGAKRTRIHNVKFHNIWTRAVKGTHPRRPDDKPEPLHPREYAEQVRPAGGSVRHCLFVCDAPKRLDDPFGGDYISGMDLMMLRDWVIADNVFAGIRGRHGGGRGAIFIWVESENVVAERNLIVGCDRGICFGNPSSEDFNMDGGIVRNNFIVGGANMALEMDHTRNTLVAHNSVYATNLAYDRTVSFARCGPGVRCLNNLVHGRVSIPPEVEQRGNRIGELPGCFRDPAAGDLHLAAEADTGEALPEVTDDFDGRARRRRPSIGADESSG